MSKSDRHEPQIYQLRVVLRGIGPSIWRRLLVRTETAVAQLPEVLQIAFGCADSHLNRFEIRGREYGVYDDGGRLFRTDARKLHLCDLKLRRLERYMYTFGDSWIHDMRIAATLPVDLSKTYPACVAGKCAAPPEDCGGPHAFCRQEYPQEGAVSVAARTIAGSIRNRSVVCMKCSSRKACFPK